MNKFFAAYKNEMIKLLHKKSVWIICIVMLVLTVFISVIICRNSGYASNDSIKWYRSDMEEKQKEAEALEEITRDITAEQMTNTDTWAGPYTDLCRLEDAKSLIRYYQSCIDMHIVNTDSDNYKCELLRRIRENEYHIAVYDNVIKKYNLEEMIHDNGVPCLTNALSEAEADKLRTENEKYRKIIDENDFAAYIELANAQIREIPLPEIEKNTRIEQNNIRLKYNITGEYKAHKEAYNCIADIENYKNITESGVSGSTILTPSQTEEYKQKMAVAQRKLESGFFNVNVSTDTYAMNSSTLVRTVFSIGAVFILALATVLAGASVSTEMANGSVKMLVVAPVKRRKIFAAKCFALFTVDFAALLLLTVACMITTLALFGADSLMPYVGYGINSAVYIAFVPYVILYALVQFVPVIFYSALAIMLSALTRNTAIAIGVSLGVNYVMASVLKLVGYVVGSTWMKYIPTVSLDNIVSGVFSSGYTVSDFMTGMAQDTEINIWFSVIYVAVLVFAMVFTARDAFCRRDIK